MTDFDRIFDPGYTAVDLFTNREAENRAFEHGLLRHLERLNEGRAVLAQPARRNVLTFYGIGGIGKTELSRRLERWLLGELPDPGEWGEAPRPDQDVRTVRVDFHGSSAVNAVDVVLQLRAAVADVGGRFPAFDLGLAAWWSLARPSTALPDLRSSGGFDVRAQITDTLNEVLSDAGARFGIGPLTVRTGLRLIDAVRTRRLRSRTLRECAPLAAVIEQTRIDPSPYVAATLAGLLSWDLERLQPGERVLVAAFADAAEYVQGGERVQERLFNRIVHLTPGILWVVTSRNRLDWDSPALGGTLPATGPQVWPGLRLGTHDDPCQHLVGDLSDTDVERYLSAASGTAGNPRLGPEVIERIRRGAHGLPLYLDLSMAIARAAGQDAIDPADYGGSLPELVTRVFADLPDAERTIARTASLIPRFDPELVARVTGGLLGDAQRFCRRSLVTRDHHALFPYRLHDAVRSAIANEAVIHRGAWAAEDRTARATALVETLRERHQDLLDDVDARLDVLELAAGLCAAHGIRAPWLLKALTDLPGMRQTAGRLPPPGEDSWMGHVSRFFEGWRERPARRRVEYLTELVATRTLPADVDRSARRFLAYAHRTAGNSETTHDILRDLLAENPDSGLLRYQLARTLHTLGRYDELHEHLVRHPLAPAAQLRIQGDLAYDRGDMAEAVAGVAARAGYLRSIGQHRVAAENHSLALWRSALAGRATVAECDAAIAETDRYGMWLNMRSVLAAKAVCLAGEDAVRDVLAELAAVIDVSSGFRGWREWTAELLHALRRGDGDHITGLRAEWTAARRGWTPNYHVVDRVFVHAGYPPTFPALRMGALGDGDEGTDERWRGVIGSIVHRA
jgi:hypothetical protein